MKFFWLKSSRKFHTSIYKEDFSKSVNANMFFFKNTGRVRCYLSTSELRTLQISSYYFHTIHSEKSGLNGYILRPDTFELLKKYRLFPELICPRNYKQITLYILYINIHRYPPKVYFTPKSEQMMPAT